MKKRTQPVIINVFRAWVLQKVNMRTLCFFFCLFSLFPAFAVQDSLPESEVQTREQLTPMEFDEKQMEEFRQNPAFDYSEAVDEDNWWTRFKRWLGEKWSSFIDWLFGDYTPPLFIRILLDILPYLLLGLLLALLLYLVARINPVAYALTRQDDAEVIFNEEEKIIKTGDIRQLIEEAVSRKDYRLAVRYHFLYILQQMSRREIVKYEPSRTDEEYLAEIDREDLKISFGKASRIYDFVWYGFFDPSEVHYDKIRRDFSKMEALIEQKNEQKL